MTIGPILNSAAEPTDPISSQIEILFEAQALNHGAMVVDSSYRISVGATYQSESYVTVAQDKLTYKDYTPAVVSSNKALLYFWSKFS